MAKGYIQVKVSTGKEALPVKNCIVVVSRTVNGQIIFEKTLHTDESGNTEKIQVEAPPKELSQTPQTKILPYDIYDISAKANGYVETLIQGVQVFPDVTAIQNIDLQPLKEGSTHEDKNIIKIPPHQLVLNATRNKQRGFNSAFQRKTAKEVCIPKYITVHLGTPTSYAENVTLTFPEYIKNVASSEIYPTWPENSIRANICAQISFALNRVYTEWYRGKGYDFQITNSTVYDQYFVKNRNIFDNINEVVDEIFQEYISEGEYEEPLFAQFCNGITVICNGLSQWGSVDLANNGYVPFDILKYYYGDNIKLSRACTVEGILEPYPEHLLKVGSSGEHIEVLQKQLNRISENYPQIPKVYPVDGYFGESSEDAVKVFQRIFRLTCDGIVGRNTWYRISYMYVSVKTLEELKLEEDNCSYPGYLLRLGSVGEEVKSLQRFLNKIAGFYHDIPKIGVEDIFGQNTENAVIAFQKEFGISPDGIVGQVTYNKIYEVYKSINSENHENMKEEKHLYKNIKFGDHSAYIRVLQTYINTIAWEIKDMKINKVKIDGKFGEETLRAMNTIQKYFNVKVSKIVDKEMWTKLSNMYNIHYEYEKNKDKHKKNKKKSKSKKCRE